MGAQICPNCNKIHHGEHEICESCQQLSAGVRRPLGDTEELDLLMGKVPTSRSSEAHELRNLLVALLFLVLVAGTCTFVRDSCRSHKSPKVTMPRLLNASAWASLTVLKVSNNEGKDWDRCTVTINEQFSANVGTIPAHSERAVPLSEFANNDGLRFNSLVWKVKKLKIACMVDGEYRVWYGEN